MGACEQTSLCKGQLIHSELPKKYEVYVAACPLCLPLCLSVSVFPSLWRKQPANGISALTGCK